MKRRRCLHISRGNSANLTCGFAVRTCHEALLPTGLERRRRTEVSFSLLIRFWYYSNFGAFVHHFLLKPVFTGYLGRWLRIWHPSFIFRPIPINYHSQWGSQVRITELKLRTKGWLLRMLITNMTLIFRISADYDSRWRGSRSWETNLGTNWLIGSGYRAAKHINMQQLEKYTIRNIGKAIVKHPHTSPSLSNKSSEK